MPSPFFGAGASGIRLGLLQRRPSVTRSAPCAFRRASSTSASASRMSTGALVAVAAVAFGAYYVYVRRNATAQAEAPGGKPTFSGFGFRTLTLSSSETVNHDVKRLRFDLATPQTKSGLTLTSALLAISFPGGGWIPVLRPYTPVNDLDEPGHIDFLVKHYPGGKQSTHLHSLKPGDSLTFMRIPGYSWKANEQRHVGLVAGGQGITPCLQLARGILKNPAERTRVTLVWGVNTDADIIVGDELTELQRRYGADRLRVVYAVSRPAPGSPHVKGYVTGDVLRTAGVLPAGKGDESQGEGEGVGKVFVCGPPAMEKALTGPKGVLTELGFTKAQVHKF